MDPVQRIPRYTLMFRTMIKYMAPGDPQRAALVAADEIASKIALAEMDEQTKRAAVIHCLCSTVEDFPPALYSNARRFIDCVDVEDILPEGMLYPSGASGSTVGSLHASLFLFDDKLVIMKRPGNGEKTGRALSGLDDLEKMTKTGGLPKGLKRSGMVCKGVVDITEVVAVDAGGSG
jgi:protein ECT2